MFAASRASAGNRSGPSTMTPTNASTNSSHGPMLNMRCALIPAQRDGDVVLLGTTVIAHLHLVAWLVRQHHDGKPIRRLNERGIDHGDDVAGLQPGLVGRTLRLHLADIGPVVDAVGGVRTTCLQPERRVHDIAGVDQRLGNAPPELPGLIDASVWIALITGSFGSLPSGSGRSSAETMPLVTVPRKPNGLPIAITGSRTASVLESPSEATVSFDFSTLSTARSVFGSRPTTRAVTRDWSLNVAQMSPWVVAASSMTWLFVRM